jgi:cytidyltransferase-like protein
MKISVVSGGFDPIHSGHIFYLKEAKSFGDKLIVALNSDEWLKNKKGKNFLPFEERKLILESLKYVDEVIDFKDDNLGSCINALIEIKKRFPKDTIIFCNGGDRTKKNIPEMSVKNISFKFGIGGEDKKNSSSSILKDWNYYKEKRVWGDFYNLFSEKNLKVKELIINPKKGMSFQKHKYRSEIWFVSEGACIVNHSKTDESEKKEYELNREDIFFVKKNEWHQLVNPYDEICKIIEIQYGEKVIEEDIERLFYFEEEK